MSLAPECAGLPVSHLQGILDSTVSALPDGTTEDFLSSLGSVGKAVAPALQQAAPSVAQGAATGATFGPWGAVIGAGAGLASSLIQQGQRKPAAAPQPASPPAASPATPASPPRAAVAPPPAETPVAQAAPVPAPNNVPSAAGVAPTPAAPAASVPQLPSGPAAAATLLSLVQNPTVLTALLSQSLGSQGKQDIATPSGANVPRGAINSLLTQLLSNASNELPEAESISEQQYLRDASGEYLVDPASPDQLGALVLFHIQPRESPASRKTAKQDLFQWLDAGDGGESVTFF